MILIAYDQERYRRVLLESVKPGDTVIEIGPHTGGSTRMLAKRAKLVIAVDKSEQAKEAFKDMPKNVKFVGGDVRIYGTASKVSELTDKCDVLGIDMGGGRFPDTVFKVWCVWSGIFRPRDSVLRNRGIGEFLRRAKISDPVLEMDFTDAGWLSQSSRKNPLELMKGLDELQNWIIKTKKNKAKKTG